MLRFSFLLVLLPACGSADDEGPRDRSEFVAVADNLERGGNAYFGRLPILKLKRRIAKSKHPFPRSRLLTVLSTHHLRLGEVEQAQAALEEAWKLMNPVGEQGGLGRSEKVKSRINAIKLARAITYLRQAEVENCISRNNQACCIFPLEGGGVHTYEEPARKALALYLELAKEEPLELSHRWMCNLLAMALSEHPAALPWYLVVPAKAFDSEYELGRFVNVAAETGVDVFSLCGGSAVDDFDGDGLLDIVVSNFHPRGPLVMHRNNGRGSFDDVTEEGGLEWQLSGLNIIAADYDSDGDSDLFALRGAWLLNDGRIRNSLLRNDGTGVFTDVTVEAGVDLPASPTQTAAFGDFNNDGELDLYVGNEVVLKKGVPDGGLPSQLFMNDGDGSFTLSGEATNDRYCKGVAAGDYDGDGDLDIYVSNIGNFEDLGVNRLYQNDGEAHFRDVASDLGVDDQVWSFATWFFDYDNDGMLDLFVGGYNATVGDVAADYMGLTDDAERPRLYRNEGGSFRDVASEVGLDRPFLPMGANFGDFDNDGWLDIYLATGNPPYDTLMPNIALRNDAGRRFQDVTRSTGLGHLQKGHGVTFADIDNDGDQDIFHELGGFLPGDGFANALFENPGHGNRFLQVELVGTKSNRSGYGARVLVVVESDGVRNEFHRAVGSVSSFGGAPRRLEIGLGRADKVLLLKISWPTSQTVQRFEEVPLDARIRITEEVDDFEMLEMNEFDLGERRVASR